MKKNYVTFYLFIAVIGTAFQASAQLAYEEITAAYKSSYQYEKTENYTDAIKSIMVVYNHYEESYTVNLRLAYLFLQQGQYANASRHYQNAQKALPSSVSPKLGLMTVALAQLQYDKAEEIGFNILKIDKYNYYANLKLAYALNQNKKYDNAETIVEKMLAFYPEDVSFLSQYAAIFAAQSLFIQATEYYSTVLILDPENINANYYFSLAK